MDLAQAHAELQRQDIGAKFYVLRSYYEGVCSWEVDQCQHSLFRLVC